MGCCRYLRNIEQRLIHFIQPLLGHSIAVISLTKNLATELAPRIRVNCIAPGWVNTDINKHLPKEYLKSESEKILVKRFGKPEEIAAAATFLASDDASFITRTVLIVDGGYIPYK